MFFFFLGGGGVGFCRPPQYNNVECKLSLQLEQPHLEIEQTQYITQLSWEHFFIHVFAFIIFQEYCTLHAFTTWENKIFILG